jgi:hypothetical protein
MEQHTENNTPPVTLDGQQQQAIDIMQRGKNVFLTGMAGTGKSFLIQRFVGQSFKAVDMCATTGIAALNLQQSIHARTGIAIPAFTIYRYAGIGIGPAKGQSAKAFMDFLTQKGGNSFFNACRRIKKAECIVIDEISMLPGETFNYLNFHFQEIRQDTRPFGGVQLVAVGDFLQLPPVSRTGIYDWCFLSRAWADAQFRNCYLTTIHRQNEQKFINILNDFREGRVRGETAEILQKRIPLFPDKNIPRLFTHNVQVDKWNNEKLQSLSGEERTFNAICTGPTFETDFLKKNLVTPEALRLRIGARVMFTANLAEKTTGHLTYANGECGNVVGWNPSPSGFGIDGKVPVVKKEDGREVLADAFTWTFDPQKRDGETGKFCQVPLRLAYALTIHKSQGLTLDKSIVDIRAAREPGQAYVAVSRVRTLAGLWLKDMIAGVHVSPDAISFMRNALKTSAV